MNLSNVKSSIVLILTSLAFFSFNGNNSTDGGLLWKITGNGLKEPSYLFGSNHGMRADFVEKIQGFWNAYNSAKQLAVESNTLKTKKLDSANIFLPKDTTYLNLLNNDERVVLDSILLIYTRVTSKEMKLQPGHLFWQLQISMSKRASEEWAKENSYLKIVDFYKGIDGYLQKLANVKSYPIIELDSKEELERLGISDYSIWFKTKNLRTQAKEMVQYLKDIPKDSVIGIEHKGMEAYYNQNLKAIYKWDTYPKGLKDRKTREIHYVLTTERNISWFNKILASIKKQSTFIAVGAAHLPGEKGLINLLRKEGYTVKSVM